MYRLRDTPARRATRENRGGDWLASSRAIVGATRLASKRTAGSRLSNLERLPNEVKLMIVDCCSDTVSIFNLALTGPEFCRLISAHERAIARGMITNNISPPLLHLAIAANIAANADWNIHKTNFKDSEPEKTLPRSYTHQIVKFVESYRRPGGYTLQEHHPDGPKLSEASRYLALHDTIRHYADRFAAYITYEFPKGLGSPPDISTAVLLRIEKALYVAQLVSDLFSWSGHHPTKAMDYAWGVFWFSLLPWEYEQVYCAQRILTEHVAGTIEVQTGKEPWWIVANRLWKFAVYQGPLRLHALELRSPTAMAAAYADFERWDAWRFIRNGFCDQFFGMSVQMHKITKLLAHYSDTGPQFGHGLLDLAPAKNWYRVNLNSTIGRISKMRKRRFLSCTYCLAGRGYAFWDETESHQEPIPSIRDAHNRFVHERGQHLRSETLSDSSQIRGQRCSCGLDPTGRAEFSVPFRYHRWEYGVTAPGLTTTGIVESVRRERLRLGMQV
ncbi:hypothetical protein F4777DRAFT_4881 [Nemania sp. FL0916]|nr:hypothetical protein F4777DRAFT_4881 [Nemania sp. FL0916]